MKITNKNTIYIKANLLFLFVQTGVLKILYMPFSLFTNSIFRYIHISSSCLPKKKYHFLLYAKILISMRYKYSIDFPINNIFLCI